MGVIFVAMAIPLPFLSVFMDDLVWFLLLMLGAEFMILCTVTPVNAVFLSCVSEDMRGCAQQNNINFVSHVALVTRWRL